MRLTELKPSTPEELDIQASQIPLGDEFEFEDDEGARRIVPADQFQDAMNAGFKFIPPEQVQRETEFADAGEKPVLAGALGLLRGVTLGATDQIIKHTGMFSEQELGDLQDANPIASTTGEIAGTIAPALLSGGTSLGARAASMAPSALAELAGKKVAQKLTGKFLSQTTSNVVKNAVRLGSGSMVEGTLYGTGKLISEDALGDAEFNAENALASMGEGALIGGAFGGLAGAGGELFKKGVKQASEKIKESLKGLIDNEIGFLKSAGAEKGHIKQILKKESLTPKDLNHFAMDLGKGADFTADDILFHGGIPDTQKGSKTLKEAAFSSLDELGSNNQIVREGAGKMMGDALDKSQVSWLDKLENGKLGADDLIYGDDLADMIQKDFADDIGDLYSPGKGEFDKLIADLREINVTRDQAGNIAQRRPLTPVEIKMQSKLFAKEAGFAKIQPSRLQEAHQRLWSKMEDQVEKVLNSTGDMTLSSQYKNGKKLFEKSITLDKIIESGRSKAVNNSGMSLTQGLATVAGGTIGGLPGAAAGYALRKAQMEYGDKTASYLLRNIEIASNKGKHGISDAVDSFFKTSQKAGNVSTKSGLKYLTGQEITEDKEKDIQEKIDIYSRDPAMIVENFVKNNQEMLKTAPKTAQALQQRVINATQFLASKVPKQDESPFKDTPRSRSEIMKFKNYVEAVENPYKTLENLKHGYFSPESMEAMKVVYPKMFSAVREEMMHRLPEFKKLSEKQKAEISKILNIETKKAYSPAGFAQLQQISAQGTQQNIQQANRPAAKKLDNSGRAQTGLDRVLAR